MQREEDYIDQLFKEHFEDFDKSPSEEVWKGIVAKGTMANGKKFALPGGWKSGLVLCLTAILSLILISGSQVAEPELPTETIAQIEEVQAQPVSESAQLSLKEASVTKPGPTVRASSIYSVPGQKNQVIRSESTVTSWVEDEATVTPASEVFNIKAYNPGVINTADFLNLEHINAEAFAFDSLDNILSLKARRSLRKELNSDTYYRKERGGHWFVSGGLILDGRLAGHGNSFSDGLVFGAGKYLTDNSFMEISMRGVWGQGFNLRATYTQLLLPGKLRPFIQGGMAWDDDLDIRLGIGLLYAPAKMQNWRFFVSASYERGSQIFDSQANESGVFELGAQVRLSGTERVLSDNNWMNSIPHYKLPTGWYVEGSSNFSFFDKTKVTRVSAYAGKNISRRWYARGGVRLGRDRVILPAHLQYHVLVREKLRFGAYTGPSLRVTQLRLGVDLGLIAYYEVLPGWSLYVAPVILDNSRYGQRIFETGIRYYLPGK